MLLVEGLCCERGRNKVLLDIDFKVVAGEVLAVLGTNGAGKSTLLGLNWPDARWPIGPRWNAQGAWPCCRKAHHWHSPLVSPKS